jgi:PPOX class probable F420-dependent enzyme
MAFELTSQVERRLTEDQVAWLTTVTPDGKPAPRPVWFVWDGEAIVIYSMNGAARLRYIERNPQVSVHFNSDGGGDIVVISGTAERLPGAPPPSEFPGLLEKYGSLMQRMGETPEWYDNNYGVALRVTPERAWGHLCLRVILGWASAQA